MQTECNIKRVLHGPVQDSHFFWCLLIGVALTQAVLAGATLPIDTFVHEDWLNWQVDNPYHWYQIRIASDLFKERLLLGYDPRFAAGYLGGLPFNPSAKLPSVLTIILSNWLSQTECYKLYLFSTSLVAALCTPIATHWMRCRRSVMVIASIFALCLWWASAIRWDYTVGMVSFVLSAYVALPFFARLRLLLQSKFVFGPALALGAIGAVSFLLHPLFPLLVVFLLLPDAVMRRSTYLTLPALGNAGLVAIISLLPNLLWLIPTLSLPGLNNGTDPYQKTVSVMKFLTEAMGLWRENSMGAKINPLLLFLSAISIWPKRNCALESQINMLLVSLFVSWALTAVFGCLGAAIPAFAHIYPNRFSPIAYLFLTVPAAHGAVNITEKIKNRNIAERSKILSILALTMSIGLSVLVLNEVRREISWTPIGHYGRMPPETAPMGELSKWILDWLRRNTDDTGRVLFETSLGRVHDGGHMAGYYAAESSREFIGGPYPYVFFAGFWDGWVFGKPIGQHSPERFSQYLDLYNIHWIIAHSRITKQYLHALPRVELVDSRFGIDLFQVKNPSTFFLEGSGKVEKSDTNRLVLSDLSPGIVIIKYHYVPGLITQPPVGIQPKLVEADPQPFIQLTNGSLQRVQLSWSPTDPHH